jgi:hypothetical protein
VAAAISPRKTSRVSPILLHPHPHLLRFLKIGNELGIGTSAVQRVVARLLAD